MRKVRRFLLSPCYATVTFWAVTSPRPLDHLPQLLIQGIHFIHLFLERCRLFTHQFQLLFMQCFLGLGLLKRNELVNADACSDYNDDHCDSTAADEFLILRRCHD